VKSRVGARSMRSRLSALAVACVLLQSYATAARADDVRERAARAYEDARKAYDGGAYQAAALGFERVFHEVANGASMFAAGRAWEKASEPALAADDYRTALSVGDLGGDESGRAKERLGALEANLGRVKVIGPDGTTVSFGHAEAQRTPANVHARPGLVTVVATLPDGRQTTRDVVVERGKVLIVDLGPPVVAPIAAPEPASEPEIVATVQPRHNAVLTAAWITGGSALAAGIAAAILAPIFNAKNNDWNASSKTDASERDTVVSLQIGTDAAFIGACALAVTSVTLFVVAARSHTPRPTPGAASYEPHVTVGPGSIVVLGRF
jgi:hypothetical protein